MQPKMFPENHLLPNHLPKHTSSIRIMSQCGGFAWLSIVCNCMAFTHLLLPPPPEQYKRPNIRFGWTLAVAINYKRNSMKEWLSWPHDSATYCTQRSHPFAPEHTNSYTSTRQCAKTAEKYIYYTHFASARARGYARKTLCRAEAWVYLHVLGYAALHCTHDLKFNISNLSMVLRWYVGIAARRSAGWLASMKCPMTIHGAHTGHSRTHGNKSPCINVYHRCH